MKKSLFLVPLFCLLATSCHQSTPQSRTERQMTSDEKITERIQNALINDTSLSKSAQAIDVTTEDGVVTLQGYVASAREKDKILRMARATHGVKDVKNELLIRN